MPIKTKFNMSIGVYEASSYYRNNFEDDNHKKREEIVNAMF